jgi:hypothetical protein
MEIRRQPNNTDYELVPRPNTTEWRVQTDYGFVTIPNFIETHKKQLDRTIQPSDVKLWGFMPYVYVGSDDSGYTCSILSGSWFPYHSTETFNQKNTLNIAHMARIENRLLDQENKRLLKRLEKLETVFDHIRQKSSIIDEFIKIAESVVNVETG